MKKNSGFTLIELVMVIVILGVLAAVALPRYVNLKTQANVAAIKGSLGAVRAAIAIYYSSTATVDTAPSYPSTITNNMFASSVVPSDPVSNTNYVSTALGAGYGWAYFSAGGSVVHATSAYSSY